jgi:hypothetical protein
MAKSLAVPFSIELPLFSRMGTRALLFPFGRGDRANQAGDSRKCANTDDDSADMRHYEELLRLSSASGLDCLPGYVETRRGREAEAGRDDMMGMGLENGSLIVGGHLDSSLSMSLLER